MAISKSAGYQVQITNHAGVDIVADLPEQFALAVASAFESRDTAMSPSDFLGLSGTAAGDIIDRSAGLGTQAQGLSYAVWKGTSPIQFSLQLIFDAETNTREDVHDKLVQLAYLVLPDNRANGLLVPPVQPQLGIARNQYTGASTAISVRIGKQWFFDSVAIESASLSTETRLHDDLPIAGAIDLQIRTIVAYGKADLLKAASMTGIGEEYSKGTETAAIVGLGAFLSKFLAPALMKR